MLSIRGVLATFAVLLCLIAASGAALYLLATKDLPYLEVFRNASRHDELFESMQRHFTGPPYHISPVAYAEMPQALIDAFLVTSNSDYLKEEWHDVRKTAEPTDFFLKRFMPEKMERRTLQYKAKFFFIYKKLTTCLSKPEILCAYLNTMHFDNGVYGANAASVYYLGKNVWELSVAESATLIAIHNFVANSSGFYEVKYLRMRKEFILRRMHELSMIPSDLYEEARAEEVQLYNYEISERRTVFN